MRSGILYAQKPPRSLLWGHLPSSYGPLIVALTPDGTLVRLDFADSPRPSPPDRWYEGRWADTTYAPAPSSLVNRVAGAALKGAKIPLALYGSPFQLKVWRELTKIPRGQVVSYNDIALALKTAPRGVGQAVGANPITILVPCHRVLNDKGELHGYASGLPRKEKLLRSEGWRPAGAKKKTAAPVVAEAPLKESAVKAETKVKSTAAKAAIKTKAGGAKAGGSKQPAAPPATPMGKRAAKPVSKSKRAGLVKQA